MYCTNCGTKKQTNGNYCSNCGMPIQVKNVITNKTPHKYSSKGNISVVLGVISLIFIGNSLVSIPFSISSIITGTRWNKQNSSKTIGKTLGIIALTISLFYNILSILFFQFAIQNMNEIEKVIESELGIEEFYSETNLDSNFGISGYSWMSEDHSVLYLEHNKNYIWYEKENSQNHILFEGNYEVYGKEDALGYLTNHLELFGITEKELRNILKDNLFSLENYYVLILNNKKKVTNEEEQVNETTTYYFGTYDEVTKELSLTDSSKNSLILTRKEKLQKIDI